MGNRKNTVATCALAASLAFLPVAGLGAEGSHPASASATSISTIEIDNFGIVSPNYYRGAQPQGDDYADLAALGVKTVIDLQEDGLEAEPTLVEKAGMKFHRIPMNTRRVPTTEELGLFLELVNNPANQPVYVHCAGGRHRTGVMTAVYRMTSEKWTSEQAFKEMKKYKYGADFLHPEFKKFVYGYRVAPRLVEAKPAPTALAVAVTSAAN